MLPITLGRKSGTAAERKTFASERIQIGKSTSDAASDYSGELAGRGRAVASDLRHLLSAVTSRLTPV